MKENLTLLKPKIDVVFHALFKKGNEKITKAMIQAATKEKIESINLDSDRHILGRYTEEKLGILDLKATLDNGTICDIEIQLANNKDTAERFLFYWSRIYSSQLVKGDDYCKLNKVIGLIIIDYEFEKTKEIESLSTKWKIKEVSTGKQIELTDVLELYIIEIPKARRMLEKEPKNELAQWVLFLNDPNESEVSKIMEDNKEIKEAMNELEKISEDEELRRVAELREKAIRDEKNGLRHAREDGLKEGIDIGTKRGFKQGIEQGTKQGKLLVAKNMKAEGIDIDTIMKITGLFKNDIEKLSE